MEFLFFIKRKLYPRLAETEFFQTAGEFFWMLNKKKLEKLETGRDRLTEFFQTGEFFWMLNKNSGHFKWYCAQRSISAEKVGLASWVVDCIVYYRMRISCCLSDRKH